MKMLKLLEKEKKKETSPAKKKGEEL